MARSDIHIHVDVIQGARLDQLEIAMSEITDALAAQATALTEMTARIDADFAHITDLLNTAVATDATDAATIADLQAQLAALQADAALATQAINDSTAALAAVDPDPTNPPVIPETPVA
jgi:hypothetical protein